FNSPSGRSISSFSLCTPGCYRTRGPIGSRVVPFGDRVVQDSWYRDYAWRSNVRRRQRGLEGEDLGLVREQGARPVLEKLHTYLLAIRDEVLPKSEAGQAAVRTPLITAWRSA